jgi:hypothetical protein
MARDRNELVWVIGKRKPDKKPGPYPVMAFDKTYWVVCGKKMQVPWKVYENFSQFFALDTGDDVVEESKTVEVKAPEVVKKVVPPVKKKDKDLAEEFKKEVIDEKFSPLKEFHDLRKKVVEMGINTHGLKKEDLQKIVDENS